MCELCAAADEYVPIALFKVPIPLTLDIVRRGWVPSGNVFAVRELERSPRRLSKRSTAH